MNTAEHARTAPPVTGVEPEMDRPRRRRRGPVWAAFGAVLLATGAGAWLWAGDGSTEAAPAAATPVATAVVERGTISATESWDGTLEYGAPYTVTGSVEGIITRLVGQGETVKRGDELFRVNEQPVTLLYGVVPMYRDLRPGDSGVDVKQLEKNLSALGYDGFTMDDQYTSTTAEAVRAWQEDIAAAQTGTVARGGVVFVPAGRQVDALHVHVGDAVVPGVPVLDVTGTEQVISLDVDIDDRDLFDIDTEVTVVLPGGEKVPGTISTTAVAAAPSESGEGSEGGATASESILQVEITLDEQVSDELSGAPVDVVVAIDKRTDVLLVPVSALLALAEGGYGLEVVGDDGSTSIVPVKTGLFGGGKVEVKGDEITDGTIVGVAGR
ncbi:MAG: efflux RND transporter periplasmic adaptor subunit [Nitriliruptorales bacterium]|nr:efflux RND transporter periplasmic adaptor subunit [Nitriliruptorales bacterium]